MIQSIIAFAMIVGIGLYLANKEDKRRFREKIRECGLDEFEEELGA